MKEKQKKGEARFYFSKSQKDNPAKSIPAGYEIYENPNGQVFLRKIPPKIVTDEEMTLVREGVKKYAKLEHYMVDVKKNSIVVYLPDRNPDSVIEDFSEFPFFDRSKLKDFFISHANYSPVLQFVMIDEKEREFRVNRWCWLGFIDNWIYLESSSDLPRLIKKYCFHLGKDSFFELI